MTRLLNDVHENVRRFNHEEAIWQRFAARRFMRKRLLQLLRTFGSEPGLTEDQLDEIDWRAAEREMQSSDCIGKQSS